MELQLRKLGLIAGSGEFPSLILEECRRRGIETAVAAIEGETDTAVETLAGKVQWMGVGQLGKLIRFFQREQVGQAIMAGRVRHVRIFGRDHPDLRMLTLLTRLPRRNTDSILRAIAAELHTDGIELIDSTLLLPGMVPREGPLTKRKPDRHEWKDIAYGVPIAREIARMDLGQTVVVRDQAVVAVEAMEGTDAAIERASTLSNGKNLTVIKVSKPEQDMRFDVPVMGVRTIEVLEKCRVSAMSVDAGKSLIFHRDEVAQRADQAGIAIWALTPGADPLHAKSGK